MHELFISVTLQYSKNLESSIELLKEEELLKPKARKNVDNYIILDAKPLSQLIESVDLNGLNLRSISTDDLLIFKKCLLYIGKGKNNRKYQHLQEGKLLYDGNLKLAKVSAELTKIWKLGDGIVAVQLFSDSDHYLSLCRANLMIKAAGNKLTNLISGSIYGLMKSKWTPYEIKKFGEMHLYSALKQCIYERPTPIYSHEVKKMTQKTVYEPKKYCLKNNYEFNGILDYFLEH